MRERGRFAGDLVGGQEIIEGVSALTDTGVGGFGGCEARRGRGEEREEVGEGEQRKRSRCAWNAGERTTGSPGDCMRAGSLPKLTRLMGTGEGGKDAAPPPLGPAQVVVTLSTRSL